MNTASIHNDCHYCFACGTRGFGLTRKLEAAHVAKRSMGQKRHDTRESVILLCNRCHRRLDNATPEPVMIDGKLIPPITPGNVAWMKYTWDEEYYDRDYLMELFRGKWDGEIEPLDEWFSSGEAR